MTKAARPKKTEKAAASPSTSGTAVDKDAAARSGTESSSGDVSGDRQPAPINEETASCASAAEAAKPGDQSKTGEAPTDTDKAGQPEPTDKADDTKPETAGKANDTKPGATGNNDGTKPGTTDKTDGTKPEAASKVEGIKPDGAKPDGAKAGEAKPDAAKAGEAKPDGTKAGGGASDQDKAAVGTDDQAKAASKPEAAAKSEAAGKTQAAAKTEAAKAGDNTTKPPDKNSKSAEKAVTTAPSHGRTTRVLRRANPVRVARSTARTTSAWAKRPSGRLILPALIAAVLLGAAGTAGAYLVPQALQSVPSPSATPDFGVDASASAGSAPAGFSAPPGLPSASAPVTGGTLPGTQFPVGGGVGGVRPADVLASWAQETGTRAGIPVVAVQAYGYAELVAGRTTPGCHLSWTTIAAVAKVESGHGSANGAVLNVDGSVAPPIRGLPLDGKGGRPEVRDHDQGALDGDTQYDRPVGPLQFFPETWTAISVGNGVDADNNGISDPNDIDDASLAAAKYLCQGGRDLAKPDAWWDAILSYNGVRPYAQKVFDAANDYGQRSRV